MNKKSIITIVIIVAVIIIAAGAYMFYSNQDDGTVTIGYLPSDHDAASLLMLKTCIKKKVLILN